MEQSIGKLKPSVLLLDQALIEPDGCKAIQTLCALSPKTNVILFTTRPTKKGAKEAILAGAKAYCGTKDLKSSHISKVLQVVQKGHVWLAPDMIPSILNDLIGLANNHHGNPLVELDGRLNILTPQERKISQMIGSGNRNKEIANSLEITERTVKAHLTSIFRKLGAPDRLQLALLVNNHIHTPR